MKGAAMEQWSIYLAVSGTAFLTSFGVVSAAIAWPRQTLTVLTCALCLVLMTVLGCLLLGVL